MPWGGIYGASKHAIHGLSDSMRLEVKGLGIKVVEVAAGGVATDLVNKYDKNRGCIPKPDSIFYPNFADEILPFRKKGTNPVGRTTIDDFARTVVDQVTREDPPALLLAGKDSWLFRFLVPFLPVWVADLLLFKRFGCHFVRYSG